ncbi:MAG: hypothetical protein IT223_06235 [Crocinitomicaceae bacterium]|nr:hypothetical protein [Crocinitomicaceae bacterium]
MKRGFGTFFLLSLLIMAARVAVCQSTGNSSATAPMVVNENLADSIMPGEGNDDFGIDDKVHYFGKDSTILDLESGKIFLYGVDSYVAYGDLEVKAAIIEFSFNEYTAFAKGVPDSTGNLMGKPIFSQGDTQFEEDSLGYNFKTRRGISYGVRTREGDAYLISEVSKRQNNGWVSVSNGMFTTCDKVNPHYHFRLHKAVVIPDDKVVSGPLYMKIRKVPTPLALPFGFFPNKKESTHGILLPGYGNGAEKGFFIQNLGYYIPFQPYLDTKILFDLYTRGSWSVRNVTNYRKRYKYSGNFNVSRTVNKSGLRELPNYFQQNTFNIQWNHQQDPKSRPNTRFNASVNMGSSQNFRNNLNSTQQDFLSSTFNSSVQYGKTIASSPFTMSLEARHSQNVQTRQVDITLPSLVVNMQRINLMKSVFKKSPIGLNGAFNASNTLSAKEQEIQFSNLGKLTPKMRNGARVNGSLSTSWKIGPFLTLNPTLNGNAYLTARTVAPTYIADLQQSRLDTLGQMALAGTWNTAMTMNTRIYGTFVLKKSRFLKAVRHQIQPSAGISYTPYQNFQRNGFFGDDGQFIGYNPWAVAAFQPGSTHQAANINFGINQNIEAKVRDKNSAKVSYKKVTLIDGWNSRAGYNLLADSLNLTNLSISAFTTIAKNITLNYSSTHSFYDRDTLGREVNQYLISTQKRLTRLEGNNLALNFRFQGGNGKNKQNVSDAPPVSQLNPAQQQIIGQNQSSFVDYSVPWTVNMSYNLLLTKTWNMETRRDKNNYTQAATFSGDVTILKRWALTVNSGYDFKAKEFTTTNLGLHWDLHCWELSTSVVPFGIRKSYFIQLNIKSSLLQDLKLQKRGNLGEETLLY